MLDSFGGKLAGSLRGVNLVASNDLSIGSHCECFSKILLWREVLVVPSLLCVEVLVMEKVGQWKAAVWTLYTLEDTPPCYSSPELRQLYA